MRNQGTIALTLLGLGTMSAVAFGVLTHAVTHRRTSHLDGSLRARFPKRRRRPTKRAATAIGPLGKDWMHGSVAMGLAAYAWHRGAGAGAVALPLASATAAVLSRTFERAIRHRAPPPGRHEPRNPSFPSGHSLRTMAVALTSAHVLTREGVLPGAVLVPIALVVPAVTGVARIYLDRHWGTDVAGGWLAGITIATVCAAVYEGLAD